MLGDIRFWVEQKLAWLVQYGTITRSSANGADAVSGRVSGVQHEARRFHPWGVRGRPPVDAETITLGVDGSSANKVEIAAEAMSRTAQGLTYAYGPNDLAEGESCLYSKGGAVVRLDDPGNAKVDAKSGQDVLVNGGGANVATVGSEVDCGGLSVTMGMSGVASVLWTPPGSVVSQVIATFPATTPITGKITNGSAHFKAPAP